MAGSQSISTKMGNVKAANGMMFIPIFMKTYQLSSIVLTSK
jgi:hypothetical protein